MRVRKRSVLFFAILLLNEQAHLLTQFSPEELKERDKWEEFLRSASIIAWEQIKGKEAVTAPWKLTLEKDGIQRYALWKDPQGRMKGYLENWKWEIAAYRLDKCLGLNMIPPTVERRFRGNRGSLQLWMEEVMSLKDKSDRKLKVPSYKVFHWNRALYLQRAIDNLIANEDRHQRNFLATKDWRLVLIDHSRSFRTSKEFTRQLIYARNGREGEREMKQLPRAFVEKLKSLDGNSIRQIMEDYLTEKEIKAVLIRRDLILKEVDRLIGEKEEDQVLY